MSIDKQKAKARRKRFYEAHKQEINEATLKYYYDNRDDILAKRKITRKAERPKHRSRWMLYAAKCRAKKEGIPFNITLADIVVPTHCPVLGIKLWSGDHMTAGSIDRIVPELGYVKGNVGVICLGVNHLKGRLKLAEVEKLVAYMKTNSKIEGNNETSIH